ncbi:MAG TPA: HAD family hydrolase [Selenomonadales bacterium]|nr:HAD family hydrolase [Selenomonadales bacterium]
MRPEILYPEENRGNRRLFDCVAVDIDGTLLNDAKEIPLANKQAIADFSQDGGTVVLVSGRMPVSVRWHSELLGLGGYYVAMNGAVIGHGPKRWWSRAFEPPAALEFLQACRSRSLYCHFYTDDTLLYDQETRWNQNWTMRNAARLEGGGYLPRGNRATWEMPLARRVEDLADVILRESQTIYKTAVFSDEPLREVWEELGTIPGLTVTSSDLSSNLEVAPTGVTKGSSLLRLMRMLGISPDRVMTIGDNYNDISMFQTAGLSVAMGNAPKDVRRSAHQVTASNEAAGVAQAIRRWAYAG